MLVKAVFNYQGQVLGRFPILVVEQADFEAGGREAAKEFRRHFPDLSLFDVSVTYEPLEENDAPRS